MNRFWWPAGGVAAAGLALVAASIWIARLLQRGVRGDERVQGHGIGLSIVQDIVKAYSGSIQVSRSQSLGGARFDLHLAGA